jgi:hypothetical protein
VDLSLETLVEVSGESGRAEVETLVSFVVYMLCIYLRIRRPLYSPRTILNSGEGLGL